MATHCFHLFCYKSLGMPGMALLIWKINVRKKNPLLKQNEQHRSVLLDELEFRKLQLGDQTVFKKVYNAYFGLAVFVAKRCGASHEEALDIVQDGFVKLFKKANQIKSANAVKSWLVATVRNQTMDSLRKQKLVTRYAEKQQTDHQSDDKYNSPFLSEEQIHELQLLVLGNLIDDIQKETNDETFSMFYREGLSIKEIANLRGEPISTITNRISRLRKRFREKFESHLKDLHDSVY